MQQLPPFDQIGVTPTPDFVNASPQAGLRGSIVNGLIFNALQHEMVNAISGMGLTPTDADYTQILQSIAYGGFFIGTFGGSADALTATIPGSVTIPALKAGMRVTGFVPMTNATTSPTLAVAGFTSGSAAATIKRRNGSAVSVGDVPAALMTFRFDGANWRAEGSVASDIAALMSSTTFGSKYAHGQVALGLVSSTSILLSPRNGNNIIVAGSQVQIPAAGVAGGTTGVYVNGTAGGTLAPSTPYYVSLAVIASVLTLRYWSAGAYGHAPDGTAGNIGVEVITNSGAPVTTDTLVGMVYINASGQFSDADGARYLLSWFNRRRKKSITGFSVNRSTTSTSYLELNTEIRNGFIAWSGDNVDFGFVGSYGNNAASTNAAIAGVSFDGAVPETPAALGTPYNLAAPTGVSNAVLFGFKTGLTENAPHFATLFAQVQGNTGTWYAANSVGPTLYTAGAQLSITING